MRVLSRSLAHFFENLMNTRTDLANAALSYLGEMRVTSIDDTNSKQARTCKQFVQDTIDEVLECHRWNCATKLAILALNASEPIWGYTNAYELPSDFIRIMEVNGQQFEDSQQFFEIQENKRLLSNWDECKIRYIARIDVPSFSPGLAEAIGWKLAGKICIPLTLNAQLAQMCAAQFDASLKRAMRLDATQTGGQDNNAMAKLIGRSGLVRSRYGYCGSGLKYGVYGPIGWGGR